MDMAALKLFSFVLMLCALVKAQQPDGYIGCFYVDSLINENETSRNVNYTGETCKAECKLQQKRYAGTKNGLLCVCGDDFQKNRNSTGTDKCDWKCNANTTEKCGSSLEISLYDSWMCITGICKNKATCEDIDADHYKCICSNGWTGTFCDNERVNSATSHSAEYLFSSTSSFLSTRITSTISSTTLSIRTLVTTTEQPTTRSSWFTGSVDKTTTLLISVHGPSTANNTRLPDTLSATNSEPHTTVYISVPVTIIIAVVVGVIIFVIIRRKRQRMKQDNSAIYNSSNGHTRGFSVVNNLKYNDHDIVQLDTTTYQKDTEENITSEKSGLTFEEISDQYITIDTPYRTTDTHSVSVIYTEIPVDEDGYGHTKSTTNVVFDPTYSHTTDLQTKHTSENTYSHINKVAKKTTSDPNINHTNEIYNTLNNNGTTGTPKPEAKSTETDDTYNTVNKNGKTISRCDNNSSSSLNEPDYDHIESKDL